MASKCFSVEHFLGQSSVKLLGDVEGQNFWQNFNAVLEDTRKMCCADTAEIFLAEPSGEDLVMTAWTGMDRDAFLDRVRFAKGEGFPGIVYQYKIPIRTQALERELRYLRRAVVDVGFRAYYCVPVVSGERVIGSLNLAWKSKKVPWVRAKLFLSGVSGILGGSILARQAVMQASCSRVASLDEPDRKEPFHRLLTFFLKHVNAEKGALILLDGELRVRQVFTEGGFNWSCVPADIGSIFSCKALLRGHGATNKDQSCPLSDPQKKGSNESTRFCLPLLLHKRLIGALFLECSTSLWEIPTRTLPELLWSTEMVAFLLSGFLREQEETTVLSMSSRRRQRGPGLPLSARKEKKEASLELRCFGSLRIYCGGREISFSSFRRKKSVQLLCLLALHFAAPREGIWIAEALWPGLSEKQALNRLYVTVHDARTVFEREGVRDTILCTHGRYFFDSRRVQIDIVQFREILAQGKEKLRLGEAEEGIQKLKEALSFYRGDLFEDELYADWCLAPRVRFRNKIITVAEELARYFSTKGAWDTVVEYLETAVALDPFREDLQQDLVKVLLRSGRKVEAQKHVQECIRLFQEDLGLEPSRETLQLSSMLEIASKRGIGTQRAGV